MRAAALVRSTAASFLTVMLALTGTAGMRLLGQSELLHISFAPGSPARYSVLALIHLASGLLGGLVLRKSSQYRASAGLASALLSLYAGAQILGDLGHPTVFARLLFLLAFSVLGLWIGAAALRGRAHGPGAGEREILTS
jgi:hypothetical protein